MEYFSEIYGQYYLAVAAVLRQAQKSPLTAAQIDSIVSATAFGESALYITPRLVSGEWPLLEERNGLYYPRVHALDSAPLTALQREFLVAIMQDKRSAAFFDKEERERLVGSLSAKPLYDADKVVSVDASLDADDFADEQYAQYFRTLLDAAHSGRLVSISFTGGKGRRVRGDFLPCKIEYSPKDDKMRLLAVRIGKRGAASCITTINLSRIDSLSICERVLEEEVDFDALRRASRENEPIVVEIINHRNALERFMVQFASYEKHTRDTDEEEKYICTLYYNKEDETELVIRLLSFGPRVRVLSPQSVVDEIRRRVAVEWQLLEQY